MAASIKSSLKASILAAKRRFELFPERKSRIEFERWQEAGKPVPAPHAVKRRIILAYARSFGAGTFIETGTYLGDMVWTVKDLFQTIFSIELSTDLSKRAQKRFRAEPKIEICQGDSCEVLPRILSRVSEPCLFWLDGHYSAGVTARGILETPIIQELETIFAHTVREHVILVDDARMFDGSHDYPTLDVLRQLVDHHRPEFVFAVANDIIRIHPPKSFAYEL
jgi:hypothetical protein